MSTCTTLLERLAAGSGGEFLGLEPEDSAFDHSHVIVLPVPFDGSSTYQKGADLGPAALLRASEQVELYDMESHAEVHRLGICTLPPLPLSQEEDPAGIADRVSQVVADVLALGRFPVVIGGEHSVSIGAIRAAQHHFQELTILQVDAHADTREEYHGSSCNHACVMARAREGGPVIQVGIRSLDSSELAKLDVNRVHPAHRIHRDADWLARIRGQLTRRTWITIDLDGLDSSQIPATGTPEPGGLTWIQVQDLLRMVCSSSEVVGLDVVELKPMPGNAAPDFLAARLLHRCLNEVFRDHPACTLPGPPPFKTPV